MRKRTKEPLHQDKQQQDKRSTSEKSNVNFEETVYHKTESHCAKDILDS